MTDNALRCALCGAKVVKTLDMDEYEYIYLCLGCAAIYECTEHLLAAEASREIEQEGAFVTLELRRPSRVLSLEKTVGTHLPRGQVV